jgi:hypothetical protein
VRERRSEVDLVKEKRVWWEHKKHLQGAEYDSEAD